MSTHRIAHDKLKVEHHLIPGLRKKLEKLAENAAIRSIIPARTKHATTPYQGVTIRVSIPTVNGFKCNAFASNAVQEVFVSTDLTSDALKEMISKL